MRQRLAGILLAMAALSPASRASAQVTAGGDALRVNGFANVAYTATDTRRYVFGSPAGGYRANFGIAFLGQPHEDLLLVLQPMMDFVQSTATLEINFVQATWRVADYLKLNLGKGRLPFGVYSDIFDAGVLRPFLAMPIGMYGPAGPVGWSYLGAGLSGTLFFGGAWGLSYDVYGGDVLAPPPVPIPRAGVAPPAGGVGATIKFERIDHAFGGRLTVLNGLRFGVGGYVGTPTGSDDLRTVYGGHIEYKRDDLEARAEIAHLEHDTTIDAYYTEIAYRFLEYGQVALRYDATTDTLTDQQSVGVHEDFLNHREVAAALNFWLSPDFSIKLSYHYVTGMRLSRPVSPAEMQRIVASASPMFPGDPVDVGAQQVIMVGSSFSF